jgi:hypothetical protein
MLIAGWSNLLPVPLIILSLLSPFPYCFLIMIASGMVRVVHSPRHCFCYHGRQCDNISTFFSCV